MDNEAGRFTLVFLGVPGDEGGEVELTYNWDESGYSGGRNFGHLAYEVDDIYETCARLQAADGNPIPTKQTSSLPSARAAATVMISTAVNVTRCSSGSTSETFHDRARSHPRPHKRRCRVRSSRERRTDALHEGRRRSPSPSTTEE